MVTAVLVLFSGGSSFHCLTNAVDNLCTRINADPHRPFTCPGGTPSGAGTGVGPALYGDYACKDSNVSFGGSGDHYAHFLQLQVHGYSRATALYCVVGTYYQRVPQIHTYVRVWVCSAGTRTAVHYSHGQNAVTALSVVTSSRSDAGLMATDIAPRCAGGCAFP